MTRKLLLLVFLALLLVPNILHSQESAEDYTFSNLQIHVAKNGIANFELKVHGPASELKGVILFFGSLKIKMNEVSNLTSPTIKVYRASKKVDVSNKDTAVKVRLSLPNPNRILVPLSWGAIYF